MATVTGEDPNQDIWFEGYSAYNGEEEGSNPYPEGSFEYECWGDGHEDAKEDEAQDARS